MKQHATIHPPTSSEVTVNVAASRDGGRLENGEWDDSSNLCVNVTQSGFAKSVLVGRRKQTENGAIIVPQDGFSDEQANTVGQMVDDLRLAKLSGQIPDLDETLLSRVSLPDTTPEHPSSDQA